MSPQYDRRGSTFVERRFDLVGGGTDFPSWTRTSRRSYGTRLTSMLEERRALLGDVGPARPTFPNSPGADTRTRRT